MSKKITLLFLFLLIGSTSSLFAAISLEEVIRSVYQNSDSAKIMKESIRKSDMTVKEKWSNALPVVSATLMGGRNYGSLMSSGGGSSGQSSSSGGMGKSAVNSSTDALQKVDSMSEGQVGAMIQGAMSALMKPRAMNVYSSSIQITQPLYTFGKVGTAIQVADEFRKTTLNSCERNYQQLQLQAVDAFYRVVLSEMALSVSERSLARKKELSELLERNLSLGAGNKAQLLAAQADVKNEQAQWIAARQNLTTTRMMLNALMGRPLDATVELDTLTALQNLLSTKLFEAAAAVDTALALRADLKAMDNLKNANEGGARIYRAMYLPSIAAIGTLSFSDTLPKGMVDWDKRSWFIGVGLSWTLFDGFANSSKAQQYRSDARKLELSRQAVSNMVRIEVLSARAECDAADSNYAALTDMLAASQESYDLTNENFKQGSGQFVELQSAQERLRQAELGHMNARYRLLRSRAALCVAIGHDIVKMEDK